MNIATRRVRVRPTEPGPGVSGIARLDRRTKSLTRRLRPGDIAVIDHLDLDRVSAEALLHGGVAAVVNVAPSISGRYPNLGPQLLVAAGVPLLDRVGPAVFVAVREGQLVRLEDNRLYADDREIAVGELLTPESIEAAMAEARAGLAIQLEAFASNTMEYVRRERDLLLDGVGVPEIRTNLTGRHVLIVVRGTTIARTWRRCDPTSGSTARCSSAWTAGPTPCWRLATARTSWSATWTRSRTGRWAAAARSSCTHTRTGLPPGWPGWRHWDCRPCSSRQRPPVRTWPCCSRTTRVPV